MHEATLVFFPSSPLRLVFFQKSYDFGEILAARKMNTIARSLAFSEST
jgi:hypothetical protein